MVEIKYKTEFNRVTKGHLSMLSSINIELPNGIISYDKTKKNEYVNINGGTITNIETTEAYIKYNDNKRLTIEKESSDIIVHDHTIYNLVIPKINGCTAMIIKSGNFTFIVHLEPREINRDDCFNNLFSYFSENHILEIDLFYSIKFGGALSIFMTKASSNNIIINKCINQDIYNFILETINVETFVITGEPKSYFLSYCPENNNLLWYIDEDTLFNLDGEKNLYLFPKLFSEKFILLIDEINNNSIREFPNFNTLRTGLFLYLYFKRLFPNNIYKFQNVTNIINNEIKELQESITPSPSGGGGGADSLKKYLKYKQKYIQLKNKLKIN